MIMLPQKRSAPEQIFPAPHDGERVEETPPSFCWLKVDGVSRYELVIRDINGKTCWNGYTDRNFMVPDKLLDPGIYEWNLFTDIGERGWWRFEIVSNAVKFLRPSAADVFAAIPTGHPRHLFFSKDISGLITSRSAEIETLKRNIRVALNAGLPEPPRFHREAQALPYREYFGRYRDFVDRDLVACALGYSLLDDRRAGAHAVASLLTICDWNPAGPCSILGPWGDEVGLSNARCLPSVYDMVWTLLNVKERTLVEQTIATYALQCEDLLNRLDFGQNPGNSHAGRVPAYLGEAALVLKDSAVPQATLERWLALSLDIYSSFFPYYGGTDGGWAEGTFYASSYAKWYLPFFMAVERYAGVRFLDRPFYQKVIQYFLHFCPPGWENHPFCDGYWCRSDDLEWPGFFAQNPYRLYAERSGIELAKQWSAVSASPEIFKLHLLDIFIPDGNPPSHSLTGSITRARDFPGAGFISLHTSLADQDKDTALLARASRYGSASHQHADQGSFALIHKGKTLISPSGYFGRGYGTRHHLEWTKSTQAHNAILVDGVGQARNSHLATGKIVSCSEINGLLQAELDISEAYPMLTSWIRRFTLYNNGILVVHDRIESEKPVIISWLLHTLSEPVLGEKKDIPKEITDEIMKESVTKLIEENLNDATNVTSKENATELLEENLNGVTNVTSKENVKDATNVTSKENVKDTRMKNKIGLNALNSSDIVKSMQLDHHGIHLDIIPFSGLPENCSVSGEFAIPLNDGVPEAYQVAMPQQFHLTWITSAAPIHDIAVAFIIDKT